MNCPACSNPLELVEVEGVNLDICRQGCGGVWFDNFELKKFDEPHEPAGPELLNQITSPDTQVQVDHSQRRNCPKCDNVVMMRHYFSIRQEVEIDECPGCGGIWLDSGELERLRSLFNSEKDKESATNEYFKELTDQHLGELQRENQESAEKIRRFTHMFRFICPSYYIPGKQDWGAF